MFPIDTNSIFSQDFAIIQSNYEVIHFDEYPILFVGLNKYHNIVLGSLLCEDEESKPGGLRFIHTIITTTDLWNFANQRITYRRLLQKVKYVYILDKDYNYVLQQSWFVHLEEIPKAYLPLPDTLCPVVGQDQMLNLLKLGRSADKVYQNLEGALI